MLEKAEMELLESESYNMQDEKNAGWNRRQNRLVYVNT